MAAAVPPGTNGCTLYFKSANEIPKDLTSLGIEIPLVILQKDTPVGLIIRGKNGVIKRIDDLSQFPEEDLDIFIQDKNNQEKKYGLVDERAAKTRRIFLWLREKEHYVQLKNKYVREEAGRILVDQAEIEGFFTKPNGTLKKTVDLEASDPRKNPDNPIAPESQLGKVLGELVETEENFLLDMELFHDILGENKITLVKLMGNDAAEKYINSIKQVLDSSREILQTIRSTVVGKSLSELKSENLEELSLVIAENIQKFIEAIQFQKTLVTNNPEFKELGLFFDGLITFQEKNIEQEDGVTPKKTTLERRENFRKKIFDGNNFKKVAIYDEHKADRGAFGQHATKPMQRAGKYPLLMREIYKNLYLEEELPPLNPDILADINDHSEQYVDMSNEEFEIFLKNKRIDAWASRVESSLNKANDKVDMAARKAFQKRLLVSAKHRMNKRQKDLGKEKIPSEMKATVYLPGFVFEKYLERLAVDFKKFPELQNIEISRLISDKEFNFSINGVKLFTLSIIGPDVTTGVYDLNIKINDAVKNKYKKELQLALNVAQSCVDSFVKDSLKKNVPPAVAVATTPLAPPKLAPVPVPALPTAPPVTPGGKAMATPPKPPTTATTPIVEQFVATKADDLRFRSSGGDVPQGRTSLKSGTQTPAHIAEREQRLGKSSGFMINSALVHQFREINRGYLLVSDCDTQKKYNALIKRGMDKMKSSQSEFFERREKTQARLAAYRDYQGGFETHETSDDNITTLGDGTVRCQYNEAEKRAEILIKPGNDRSILVALEANQFIQPLKIKIPLKQGQPITENDLNKSDIEFLLKTLVAGKISNIPVQVDTIYEAMIAKKFPEVIEKIENIKAVNKNDINALIKSKGDYELSHLVDVFSADREQDVPEEKPDEDDNNRRRGGP
jgi:hypothetical protein